MLPPIHRSRGGWLSDETLALERRRFQYGMRNQYILKPPPLYARNCKGVYSMSVPKELLTRQQARSCALKDTRPVDYQAGKPKLRMMSQIIAPLETKSMAALANLQGGEEDEPLTELPSLGQMKRKLSRGTLRRMEIERSWTKSFQAGVWFWTNSITHDCRVDTPENLRNKSSKSKRVKDDSLGTGSLVYDSQAYADFKELMGGDT